MHITDHKREINIDVWYVNCKGSGTYPLAIECLQDVRKVMAMHVCQKLASNRRVRSKN